MEMRREKEVTAVKELIDNWESIFVCRNIDFSRKLPILAEISDILFSRTPQNGRPKQSYPPVLQINHIWRWQLGRSRRQGSIIAISISPKFRSKS